MSPESATASTSAATQTIERPEPAALAPGQDFLALVLLLGEIGSLPSVCEGLGGLASTSPPPPTDADPEADRELVAAADAPASTPEAPGLASVAILGAGTEIPPGPAVAATATGAPAAPPAATERRPAVQPGPAAGERARDQDSPPSGPTAAGDGAEHLPEPRSTGAGSRPDARSYGLEAPPPAASPTPDPAPDPVAPQGAEIPPRGPGNQASPGPVEEPPTAVGDNAAGEPDIWFRAFAPAERASPAAAPARLLAGGPREPRAPAADEPAPRPAGSAARAVPRPAVPAALLAPGEPKPAPTDVERPGGRRAPAPPGARTSPGTTPGPLAAAPGDPLPWSLSPAGAARPAPAPGAAGPVMAEPALPLPEQLVRAVRLAVADGIAHMEVALTPPELGTVRVSATLDNGALHLHILAERPETQVLLAQSLPDLERLLAARGLAAVQVAIGAASDPPADRRAPGRRDGERPERGRPLEPEPRPVAPTRRRTGAVDLTV